MRKHIVWVVICVMVVAVVSFGLVACGSKGSTTTTSGKACSNFSPQGTFDFGGGITVTDSVVGPYSHYWTGSVPVDANGIMTLPSSSGVTTLSGSINSSGQITMKRVGGFGNGGCIYQDEVSAQLDCTALSGAGTITVTYNSTAACTVTALSYTATWSGGYTAR